MHNSLKYISLFSGIGGIDLGLDRAGLQCVAQVEIDEYCRKVLAKHWPEVPRYDDIKTVGQHNLPECDLICGGFPCQDISNAGKRAGIDGERSGLWQEFYRIICELRPRYVLVENVSALLIRGVDRVLGDLAASGYDAEWDCIPAAAVGAPHIRDRLFILAYTNNTRLEGLWPERTHQGGATASGHGRQSSVGCGEADVADADSHNEPRRGGVVQVGRQRCALQDAPDSNAGRTQWAVEPGICRVVNGIPSRVDRLKGLGNAVVPQVAQYVGECIVEFDRRSNAQPETTMRLL